MSEKIIDIHRVIWKVITGDIEILDVFRINNKTFFFTTLDKRCIAPTKGLQS